MGASGGFVLEPEEGTLRRLMKCMAVQCCGSCCLLRNVALLVRVCFSLWMFLMSTPCVHADVKVSFATELEVVGK